MSRLKSSRNLSEDDWRSINPKLANTIARDNRVLKAVDKMLSTPNEDMDSIIEVTRVLLAQRDGAPCDNDKLIYEIDSASSFICNQALFIEHVLTTPYSAAEL